MCSKIMMFTVLQTLANRFKTWPHLLERWIKPDSMVCFVNTCPLDSDLSGG